MNPCTKLLLIFSRRKYSVGKVTKCPRILFSSVRICSSFIFHGSATCPADIIGSGTNRRCSLKVDTIIYIG